jgi:hypothetical protein
MQQDASFTMYLFYKHFPGSQSLTKGTCNKISKTLITDTLISLIFYTVFINLERKVSGSSTDLSTDEKESEDEDKAQTM